MVVVIVSSLRTYEFTIRDVSPLTTFSTKTKVSNQTALDFWDNDTTVDDAMRGIQDMSMNDQIAAYRVQMKEMAAIKAKLAKLKAEDTKSKEDAAQRRISEEDRISLLRRVCLAYAFFRVLQLKYTLDVQVRLMALFQQTVRGNCHKEISVWPLPPYVVKRKVRRHVIESLIDIAMLDTSDAIVKRLTSLCEEETNRPFETTHIVMSGQHIRKKWKAFGGTRFTVVARRFLDMYVRTEPMYDTFVRETVPKEKWNDSLSRASMVAVELDEETVQTERDIYFGNGVVGGVADALYFTRDMSGHLLHSSRNRLLAEVQRVRAYDIKQSAIGKYAMTVYNSKTVVGVRYKMNKMKQKVGEKVGIIDNSVKDPMRDYARRKRWVTSFKWTVSSGFRSRVVRLQSFCRRLIAQRELYRLRKEKARLDRLINRVIRKWRLYIFMKRLRRRIEIKKRCATVINRQCRVFLGRQWRKRRWRDMIRAAIVIQANSRRFLQRVPYDVHTQHQTHPRALFPESRLFLRAYHGKFLHASMRRVRAQYNRRSFVQRWTASAGYRRREKHSSYIICSGESILLRSYQGSYLSDRGTNCKVALEGIKRRPQRNQWWTIIKHNEDGTRSSMDYVRSHTTHLTPIVSGDLVRLISLDGRSLCATEDGDVTVSACSRRVIHAQQLFTVSIESCDVHDRSVRAISPTLRVTKGLSATREILDTAKQILMTSIRIEGCWTYVTIFSDAVVTLFAPDAGRQLSFRANTGVLSAEHGCRAIMTSLSLATPSKGFEGGLQVSRSDIVDDIQTPSIERCLHVTFDPSITVRVRGSERSGVVTIEVRSTETSEETIVRSCVIFGIDAVRTMLSNGRLDERILDHVRVRYDTYVRAQRVEHELAKQIHDVRDACEGVSHALASFSVQRMRTVERAVDWIRSGKAQSVFNTTERLAKLKC